MERREAIKLLISSLIASANFPMTSKAQDINSSKSLELKIKNPTEYPKSIIISFSYLETIRFNWKGEIKEISMQEVWDALN